MADTETLRGALEQAVEGLAYIGWKRMFGYDAVFRDGTIFALIWKEGRRHGGIGCRGSQDLDPSLTRHNPLREFNE